MEVKCSTISLYVHSFLPFILLLAGFDRLMAVLCQSNSLRDVLAFPKSFKGYDLLAGAPSELSDSELASYHISVRGK